jgi:RNA polymerase sigma factor (sigma-70 family)
VSCQLVPTDGPENQFPIARVSEPPSLSVTDDHDDPDRVLEANKNAFEAIAQFYRLHGPVLLSLARRQLRKRGITAAEYSPEDLLQSSMRTVLEQIIEGKISAIADDSGALRIVRRLITEKIINRTIYTHALKRHPSQLCREDETKSSAGTGDDDPGDEAQAVAADGLDLRLCGLARAEVEFMAAETVETLLKLLEPASQVVVRMRLDTYTIAEIAAMLGVSERTVNRWLEEVRQIWDKSGLIDRTAFRRRRAAR